MLKYTLSALTLAALAATGALTAAPQAADAQDAQYRGRIPANAKYGIKVAKPEAAPARLACSAASAASRAAPGNSNAKQFEQTCKR